MIRLSMMANKFAFSSAAVTIPQQQPFRSIKSCFQDMAKVSGTKRTDLQDGQMSNYRQMVLLKVIKTGIQQAIKAGKVLQQNGFEFDLAYTSVLTRAIQTFNYAADELDCHYIPVVKSWKLNERHYGALQGLNKLQTVEKHGKDQVQIWRRSFDIPPPQLEEEDKRHPKFDKKYTGISPQLLPRTESLKTTIDRVLPFWDGTIVPQIKAGKKIIIVAHGNSLRAIVKALNNISESEITQLNIPTAIPLVYDFNENMKVVKHSYLADPEQLEALINKVKKQTGGGK